jgi:predicted flap endonuclease-1-like 5' DNA nuclease
VTLIAYLWGFMLLVTLLAAIAGWSWAEARARPRWRVMEEERRNLRAELLNLVGGGAVSENGDSGIAARRRIADLEQALAEARGRAVEVEVLRLRIAELERAGAAGPHNVAALDVTEYTRRISALENDLAIARGHIRDAGDMPTKIAALEAELAEADAAHRETEQALAQARDAHEQARMALAAAPPPEDRNRIFLLEQELEAARGKEAAAEALAARVHELESAPAPISEDAHTLMQWRNRYLGERVAYLESHVPAQTLTVPAPAPIDNTAAQERADRRAWRARYFEQRTLHLEEERKHLLAPPAETVVDDAPLKARVAELETELAAASATATRVAELEQSLAAANVAAARVPDLEQRVAATGEVEHESVRARWKARYLEARVRYLEDKLNAAPAAAASLSPEPVIVAPTLPIAPVVEPKVFRMERPAALSAPRNGASDDLRLIDGVNAQAQATLNAIGVFHFDQLARWSPANVAWVDQYLNLRGRIVAERWVEQAQKLALGVLAS